jgi:hypothetical protein
MLLSSGLFRMTCNVTTNVRLVVLRTFPFTSWPSFYSMYVWLCSGLILDIKYPHSSHCTVQFTYVQSWLEVPCKYKVSLHIRWSNNIYNFIHIEQNPFVLSAAVIVLAMSEPMLDLGKGLLDQVEVRGVWRQIFNMNTLTMKLSSSVSVQKW